MFKLYANRYLRYFPGVALTVLYFMSQIPKFIADGPFFEEMDQMIRFCNRNWPSAFLFTTNYLQSYKQVKNNEIYILTEFIKMWL